MISKEHSYPTCKNISEGVSHALWEYMESKRVWKVTHFSMYRELNVGGCFINLLNYFLSIGKWDWDNYHDLVGIQWVLVVGICNLIMEGDSLLVICDIQERIF